MTKQELIAEHNAMLKASTGNSHLIELLFVLLAGIGVLLHQANILIMVAN